MSDLQTTDAVRIGVIERDASQAIRDEIAILWQRAGLTRSWNDPAQDIDFALGSVNATILCAARAHADDKAIIATAMTGHDGHRGTVYYLAVDPDHQGKGLGRQMMQAVEDWLLRQGIWKLNLMVREDNAEVTAFYEHLGYDIEPRTVLSKMLDAD